MIGAEVTETRFLATEGGSDVSAILMRPSDASALLVLGHGAGTPIRHPVMVGMANALAQRGIATFRFNYPYSEQRKESEWQESLDPLGVLLTTACSAVVIAAEAAHGLPVFVGGRSMSSQVMSLAVAEGKLRDVRGVVLFVFPMHWRKLLDDPIAHLRDVPVPMLFVQGNRDDLTDLRELAPILDRLGQRATLYIVDGADHFYAPPEEDSGRPREEMLLEVAEAIRNWTGSLV